MRYNQSCTDSSRKAVSSIGRGRPCCRDKAAIYRGIMRAWYMDIRNAYSFVVPVSFLTTLSRNAYSSSCQSQQSGQGKAPSRWPEAGDISGLSKYGLIQLFCPPSIEAEKCRQVPC